MSVSAWLESRTPTAPDALRARIVGALGGAAEAAGEPFDACSIAATALLEQTLSGRAVGRETALDLLAADALITYAFEAAAEDVDALEGRAAGTMRRLSALVATAAPDA